MDVAVVLILSRVPWPSGPTSACMKLVCFQIDKRFLGRPGQNVKPAARSEPNVPLARDHSACGESP